MAKRCYYTPYIMMKQGIVLLGKHCTSFIIIGLLLAIGLARRFSNYPLFSGRKAEHFFGEKRLITVGFKWASSKLFEVDLSLLNGYNSGWFQLDVTANICANQSWAFWLRPCIERC